MIPKLRRKFILINMVLVTVMLLVIFSLVVGFTAGELERQSQQTLQAVAVMPMGTREPVRQPWFSIEMRSGGWLITGSEVFDLEDETFLQTVAALATEQEGVLPDYDLRYLRSQTPRGEKLVFLDMTAEQETLQTLVEVSIAIGVVAFVLFWIISLFLARWAVKPVEQAWNQQRQFVADASHELKTPLTVILTNLELLQDCPAEEKGRFLQSIQTTARQMRGLVEGLLDLARADNGTAKMEFTELDFSRMVESGLLPFEPVYFEAGLSLESRIQEGVQVRGSVSHLHQVLDILLDNACKYADPNTPVRVQLISQGKQAMLTVASIGTPLTRQEQKDIFKRFYRCDQARAMDGSYGLGLSIAQTIVGQHAGRIWADSQNGWNVFYVQLPIL